MHTPPSFAGSIPENYDRYLGPYIFEPYAIEMAERVPPNGRRLLEIACGTGRVTAHLRTTLPNAEIIATDLNPDMLAIARKRLTEAGVSWQTADAQNLPFDDAGFDTVVCQFGLMFMPDQLKAMREMYRVLKPGGRLLLSTWDRLENNPSFDIANRKVAAYFPDDPPRFFLLPFSLYDESLLLALAGDAGIKDVSLTAIERICAADSAAGVATGMLDGSPLYTQIMNRDPELLPVMKEALANAMAREYGDAPMRSPMRAWFIEGKR